MKTAHTLLLVASTLTTGLMAGLFAAFAYSVMPGLGQTDDRSFVAAMQKINAAILNPLFMSLFMGGLLITIAATVLSWRADDRSALPWVIAGLVLYILMFVITSAVNVPLNDKLAAAGDPDRIKDLGAVRSAFESRWVTWNIVRAVVNTAAFACLAWALVLHGRATAPADPASAPAVHYQHPAAR